jgi:hypothetical protein
MTWRGVASYDDAGELNREFRNTNFDHDLAKFPLTTEMQSCNAILFMKKKLVSTSAICIQAINDGHYLWMKKR